MIDTKETMPEGSSAPGPQDPASSSFTDGPANAAPTPTRSPTARDQTNRAAAFYELTKPGIALFVLMTTGASYWVAARANVTSWPVLLSTLLGTLAATAGALALNQYLEREVDGVMHRTRNRPLPSGRLSPGEALAFGLGLCLGGVVFLALFVGWLPAAITAFSAAAYNLIYTPLKSRSYFATLAGAVPGALPALIGWTAAEGAISSGAVVLFGIAYLWQIPHVFALAWLLKEDYHRAGFFFLIPPAGDDGRVVGLQMVLYATILIPVSLTPTLLGLTGGLYFAGALVLGILLWAASVSATVDMTRGAARRVFFGSLLYHPLLMLLLFSDTVKG